MTTTNKRQQLVRQVISQYCDGDTLTRIMLDWQNNYSNEPISKLQTFLSENCKREDLDVTVGTLLKEIIHGFSHIKSQEAKTTAPVSKKLVISPLLLTFYQLYERLYKNCPEVHQADILAQFFQNTSDLDASDIVIFRSYLASGSDKEMVELTAEQMRSLISQFYQAMCLWLGPVDADNALFSAIEQVKQSGHAQWVDNLI